MPHKQRPPNPPARAADQAMLEEFVQVYCRAHRAPADEQQLCDNCRELLAYAHGRLARCPYDPKPACRKCPTHCYAPAQRQRIREVMKYSGMHFVKRGGIDWLMRYLR